MLLGERSFPSREANRADVPVRPRLVASVPQLQRQGQSAFEPLKSAGLIARSQESRAKRHQGVYGKILQTGSLEESQRTLVERQCLGHVGHVESNECLASQARALPDGVADRL